MAFEDNQKQELYRVYKEKRVDRLKQDDRIRQAYIYSGRKSDRTRR